MPLTSIKAQSNIADHVQALGQKYMGAKVQDVFTETSIHEQKGSPVPVQNFVNAQCMCYEQFSQFESQQLISVYRLF